MWECVCDWLRSHSASMQNILQNLGAETQITDIGSDGVDLSMTPNVDASSLFMVLLFMIWAALFLYGRKQQREGKPRNNNPEDGGASGSGDGAGGNNPNAGNNTSLF